jgi:hypothetical protein
MIFDRIGQFLLKNATSMKKHVDDAFSFVGCAAFVAEPVRATRGGKRTAENGSAGSVSESPKRVNADFGPPHARGLRRTAGM